MIRLTLYPAVGADLVLGTFRAVELRGDRITGDGQELARYFEGRGRHDGWFFAQHYDPPRAFPVCYGSTPFLGVRVEVV